jgi:hypothetical protein
MFHRNPARAGFLWNITILLTKYDVFSVLIGIVLNNEIKELCILTFNENTIKEIEAINGIFNLIHIDWYNCNIIAGND